MIAFEEAREAVVKIQTLKSLLTPGELETLEILLDKENIIHIAQSLDDAKQGNIEPIGTIV